MYLGTVSSRMGRSYFVSASLTIIVWGFLLGDSCFTFNVYI
jgi:hypothetical protein